MNKSVNADIWWEMLLASTMQDDFVLSDKTHTAKDSFPYLPALEGKVRSGEKKAEALAKDKKRMEAELESMTKKSHDASGQLVHISQELLKKERY